MASILQIELRQYVANHNFEVHDQDGGVVLYIPVTVGKGVLIGHEAHYVETYGQARVALGY